MPLLIQRTLFVLFSILVLVNSLTVSFARTKDLIYLANGKVIECKIKGITGDYIDYKDSLGKRHKIARVNLASHHDQVKYHYWGGDTIKTIDGNVNFARPLIIDMNHEGGHMKMWTWMRHQMILGLPVEQQDNIGYSAE